MGVVVPPVPPLAVPTPTMQPAPPPPDPRCLGLLARRGLAPPAPDPTHPSSGESRAPLQPTGCLQLRRAGALFMPCTPTAADAPSALTAASRHYARARVQALACAGSDDSMALRADVADLTAAGAIIEQFADFGINANTAQKDNSAWRFWEEVCEAQGTSPLRTTADVRDFLERQAHLLAVLLMYAFAVCTPRDKSRSFVKPRSALAYPLAIIRIFGRWGICMLGYKALVAAMNGLMRMYLANHGPHSLAPRRAEPMKFDMMRAIYRAQPTAVLAGRHWTDADHDVFIFIRLNVFLMYAAFRLGEIVAHRSGEIMFITYTCLV